MHIQMDQLNEPARFQTVLDPGDDDNLPSITISNVVGSDGTAVWSIELAIDEADRLATCLSTQVSYAVAGIDAPGYADHLTMSYPQH